MSAIELVQPGDIAVIDTGGDTAFWINLAQRIADRGRKTIWDHAVVASRWDRTQAVPVLMIVEAEPGGARETAWHYEARPHKWSAGILPPCLPAGAAAMAYIGVPYSGLDYEALMLHSLHIPAPGLRDYISDTHHMICSQLADQARADGGSHLFKGRWPGYVKPSDLGHLLGA